MWVDAGDGWIVVTIYAWTGQGLEGANRALYLHLAKWLLQWNVAYFIIGDLQVSPSDFHDSFWPATLRVAVAGLPPDQWTYRSGEARTNIDFALVDLGTVASGTPICVAKGDLPKDSPHSPVLVGVARQSRAYRVRRVKRAATILPDVPVGCAPAPPPWPEVPLVVASQAELNAVWSGVAAAAETELLGRRGLPLPSPEARRGGPLRVVEQPFRQEQARRGPRCSALAGACHQIVSWSRDAIHLVGVGKSHTVTFWNLANRLVGRRPRVSRGEPAVIAHLAMQVGTAIVRSVDEFSFMPTVLRWFWLAVELGNVLQAHDVAKAQADWKDFLWEASKGQAPILHKLCKEKSLWVPPPGKWCENLDPVDYTALAKAEWADIWRVGTASSNHVRISLDFEWHAYGPP